jgi:3-methyladenine DNA glycosylase Tag
MNTLALWDHALDHLRATADDPEQLLNQWRSEAPDKMTDRDLLAEYGWVVISCGLTPQVTLKHWPRLGEAFWHWHPADVAAHSRDVRVAALGVMKNVRKMDAILAYADDLARAPGEMARLAALPAKEALAQLTTLPFVGANNKYHLARNLGWDVVVKTGPVPRLAAYLETTAEQLCETIANQTGERVRTVDLVLWNWGHQVGDAAMKEMASLFRLL